MIDSANINQPQQSASSTQGDDCAVEYFCDDHKNKLETEMRSRKFSPKTMAVYIYYNRSLCQFLQKPPDKVTSEDIKRHLAFMEKSENATAASLNLMISAIKFFYRNVLKSDITCGQHRPRQDKRLPIVLSKEEIKKIMVIKNNKHRLLLMLVYASGLRVSEVVSLKRSDIDLIRKSIMIVSGKGRKDRYTILSDMVINALNDYYIQYKIDKWVFPGQNPNSHLSVRSAQHIFENALKNANIHKDASIHCLRHSFATHLLESGIDVRYIQELLGHSSVRTTERYTHVARNRVLSIRSPLDTIDDTE